MDVRIQELTSDVFVIDAQALLTPEVLAQIVMAVQEALREEAYHADDRHRDRQFDRRATELD